MIRNLVILITLLLSLYSRNKKSLPKDKIKYGRDRVALVQALTLGNKKYLSHKTKSFFIKTHTQHLLTPSALHLISLLTFVLLFIKASQRKRKLIELLITVIFASQNFAISLKRISLFHISNPLIKLITKEFGVKSSNKLNFFIFFFLDFLFGTYHKGSFSFILSFLFLGIIFTHKNKLELLLSFYISQLFVGFIIDKPFHPIGALLGLIITPLITPIFPIAFLSMIINDNVTAKFFTSIEKLTSTLSSSDILSFSISPNLFLFIASVGLLTRSFNKKILLFSLILLFTSKDLTNIKGSSRYWHKITVGPKYLTLKSLRRTTTGFKIKYKEGIECNEKFINGNWANHCNFRN